MRGASYCRKVLMIWKRICRQDLKTPGKRSGPGCEAIQAQPVVQQAYCNPKWCFWTGIKNAGDRVPISIHSFVCNATCSPPMHIHGILGPSLCLAGNKSNASEGRVCCLGTLLEGESSWRHSVDVPYAFRYTHFSNWEHFAVSRVLTLSSS